MAERTGVEPVGHSRTLLISNQLPYRSVNALYLDCTTGLARSQPLVAVCATFCCVGLSVVVTLTLR